MFRVANHEPCKETLYFFKPKDKNTEALEKMYRSKLKKT
jgi:hypothetical protein